MANLDPLGVAHKAVLGHLLLLVVVVPLDNIVPGDLKWDFVPLEDANRSVRVHVQDSTPQPLDLLAHLIQINILQFQRHIVDGRLALLRLGVVGLHEVVERLPVHVELVDQGRLGLQIVVLDHVRGRC